MKQPLLLLLLALAPALRAAATADSTATRPASTVSIDAVPAAILHTNKFLRGNNPETRTMNRANTLRLKWAFLPPDTSQLARICREAYQGAGLAAHQLNPELGNPFSAYLFQGAPIVQWLPDRRGQERLSLNYEWNFGLTFGWNPYDAETHRDNHVIGSRVTAYMDLDLYLRLRLTSRLAFSLGVAAAHFSNGNTAMPNAGLNTLGVRAGLSYGLGTAGTPAPHPSHVAEPEAKAWGCDVVVYGAWKCKGVDTEEGAYAIPGTFGVAGFSVNPMRRLTPWLRVGPSADGVYDHGANLIINPELMQYTSWNGDLSDIHKPHWYRQLALGLSLRAEFVMPYFSINAGVGRNLLYAHGLQRSGVPESYVDYWNSQPAPANDFSGFYEVLALKVALAGRTFLHIGYSLYDFRYPNNLMLGLGLRL